MEKSVLRFGFSLDYSEMAAGPYVDLAIDAQPGIQTWSLGFTPVNTIGLEFLASLGAALEAAEAEETVAVIVLTSSLRVFSAGADARWIKQVVETEGAERLLERFKATVDRFRDLCVRMRRSDLLFVAAIDGHALAGGLELAAACDLRSPPTTTASRLAPPR